MTSMSVIFLGSVVCPSRTFLRPLTTGRTRYVSVTCLQWYSAGDCILLQGLTHVQLFNTAQGDMLTTH